MGCTPDPQVVTPLCCAPSPRVAAPGAVLRRTLSCVVAATLCAVIDTALGTAPIPAAIAASIPAAAATSIPAAAAAAACAVCCRMWFTRIRVRGIQTMGGDLCIGGALCCCSGCKRPGRAGACEATCCVELLLFPCQFLFPSAGSLQSLPYPPDRAPTRSNKSNRCLYLKPSYQWHIA